MTDQITVPRETWDATVGALKNIAEGNLGPYAWQADYAKIRSLAIQALTAANAVSEPHARDAVTWTPETGYVFAQKPQAQGEAWVWNPASTEWEGVRAFGHWQQGAIYSFGPAQPEPLAHPQATEPAGYKLVPVEPTQQMLDAVVTTLDDHLLGPDAEKQYREDWAAMLAAAPEAKQ